MTKQSLSFMLIMRLLRFARKYGILERTVYWIDEARTFQQAINKQTETFMKIILKTFLILILFPVVCFGWDKWNVELISNNDISGDYNCLRIQDDIAYCTNDWGLILFDISDPNNPNNIFYDEEEFDRVWRM